MMVETPRAKHKVGSLPIPLCCGQIGVSNL